jgi:nitroreductase
MKRFIKKMLPKYLKYLIVVVPIYLYDIKRFYLFSSYVSGYNNSKKLTAKIIERYHSIEKGLTMPEFRKGFGQLQLEKLIKDLINYSKKYDKNNNQVIHGVGVVFEYEELHKSLNYSFSIELQDLLNNLRDKYKEVLINRQIETTKDEYFSKSNSDFDAFSFSRASIRNYTSEPIDLNTLRDAVRIAQSAPSACNRQSTRVYIYTDPKQISDILNIQGGNRGFGHLTDKLIVVTSTLGVWGFISERYQSYVDGGIFAMNLLHGLHYKKIGACILNCSIKHNKDKLLRKVCKIDNSENFIAMISCGNLPNNFKKAYSLRFKTEDILTINPK